MITTKNFSKQEGLRWPFSASPHSFQSQEGCHGQPTRAQGPPVKRHRPHSAASRPEGVTVIFTFFTASLPQVPPHLPSRIDQKHPFLRAWVCRSSHAHPHTPTRRHARTHSSPPKIHVTSVSGVWLCVRARFKTEMTIFFHRLGIVWLSAQAGGFFFDKGLQLMSCQLLELQWVTKPKGDTRQGGINAVSFVSHLCQAQRAADQELNSPDQGFESKFLGDFHQSAFMNRGLPSP